MVYELDTRRTTYSNIDTGLRNNTVLAIMFDQDRNVWLALDNGLGYILHSSPYANLQGTNSHIGTGYASTVYAGKLYLGTGQGLFVTDFPLANTPVPPTPRLLPGMSGQVWALDQINGSLFCGNDNGCYLDGNHVLFNGLDGFFVLNSKKKGGSWMQEPPSFLPFYFFTFLLFTAAACRYRPGYRRRHRARGR